MLVRGEIDVRRATRIRSKMRRDFMAQMFLRCVLAYETTSKSKSQRHLETTT